MTALFYGCDCSCLDGRKLKGKSLSEQKESIRQAVGDRFDENNWYCDSTQEILVPFLQRPGAIALLCRAREGDEIWCDVPERMFSLSARSNDYTFFAKAHITVHSTVPKFATITKTDSVVINRRYSTMLASIGLKKERRIKGAGKAFTINAKSAPIGWRLRETANGMHLVPSLTERVTAMLIYEAMIDHGIVVSDIKRIFNTNRQPYSMARAYELHFPIENTHTKTRPAIPLDGPSLPNVRHMIRRLAYSPMSIREMAIFCNMSPLEAYTIAQRATYFGFLAKHSDKILSNVSTDRQSRHNQIPLLTSIQFLEMRSSYKLKQQIFSRGTLASTERTLAHVEETGVLVTVPEEFRLLVESDSPLVEWEKICDAVNGVSSSAHIFLGLDGVDDPEPLETCELSLPEQDHPDTPLEPSLPPDQEPDQPDAEQPPPPAC